MERIKKKLSGFTMDDFIKGLAIYAVAIFLIIFLVLPLAALFAKAFQNADGTFAGLAQFKKYFSSSALSVSIGNTFFISIIYGLRNL